MRRAIVHIGLPRTGTTSFQRMLFDMRQALDSCGILYPDLTPRAASQPHLNHQHLGETLDGRRPKAERTELLDRLRALLRETSADTVILSYEGLCWRGGRWFSRSTPKLLAGLFERAGFAMETLLTVKPQAEYLNSMYTLRTQWLNETRDFITFVQSQLLSRRLRYDTLAAPWRAACNGRLHTVPLRDARSDRPFLHRILIELGLFDRLRTHLPDTLPLENSSPGPVAVEIARRLGSRFRFGGRAPALRDVTRFIEQQAWARKLDTQRFQGIIPDLRARIEAEFFECNDSVADWSWQAAWQDRVQNAPLIEANEITGASRRSRDGSHDEFMMLEIEARARLAHGSRRVRMI